MSKSKRNLPKEPNPYDALDFSTTYDNPSTKTQHYDGNFHDVKITQYLHLELSITT